MELALHQAMGDLARAHGILHHSPAEALTRHHPRRPANQAAYPPA
ncbi:hypothetical protein AB5J55_42425 [Streptomyces sp. R11]|uniref:Uncharacterized protein n=1 Tax=Streptomyces sp. R11 TaxID=3238625 RepID=A0AB39NDG6_9ACTN